ncbi:MAG: potassium transporter TrkG [Nitrososphaera sp.]
MHRLFVILDENTNVASAVQQMNSHKAETIIVSRNGMAAGIVTDSDILDNVVMKGEDSDQVFLKSVMSMPLVTISARGTVKQALQLMRLNQVKRIPITDTSGVVGVVTQESLANAVRTSVIERTFSRYRSFVREEYKPILSNLGILLQFAGVLLVVPAFFGAALGEVASTVGILFAVVGLSFSGFFLSHIGEKGAMNLKQASIFIVSGFILLSLFGSIPYAFINPFWEGIDAQSLFVNSFFESASGFTTTGLSVLSKPENLPQSLDFYHSYTQWVGGLGFVYLVMILFFPERKLSAMRSVLGGGLLRVRELLVTIVGIFSAYTIILTLAVAFLSETSNLYATSLIFSTITSGGFIPASDVITPTHPERLSVLGIGMILSALPFAFHYSIFTKGGLRTRKLISIEVAVFLILIAASIVIFFGLAWGNVDIYSAIFHVTSASTTTGFQYLDIHSLSYAPKIFLILIMLIGGAAFSTAGGIKVGRLVILYQEFSKKKGEKETSAIARYSSSMSISSTANPYRGTEFFERLKEGPKKRDLEMIERQEKLLKRIGSIAKKKIVREILVIIALYLIVAFVTASVLQYLANSSYEDALFESVSALTTTGLTSGITSLNLDLVSKLVLTMNMIIGRFEIIAILYIFFNYFRK